MNDRLNTYDFTHDSKKNEVVLVDGSPRFGSDIGSETVGKRIFADAFYLSDKFVHERPCAGRIVQRDIFADVGKIIFNAWSKFQSHLEPDVPAYRELLAKPAKYGFGRDSWPLVLNSFTPDALQVLEIVLGARLVLNLGG